MSDQGYVAVHSVAGYPLFGARGPLLSQLDLELTERCNNACQHCYINLPADDAQAARRELTTAQWRDVLRQAAELGALEVRFTGGEPLLRPDFAELYLAARRLGLRVVLFTNARLITPELADLFVRVPPLKKLEVSVYGMHAASYDAVAGARGAYAEFRRGVELLLERGVGFVVKSVLLPANRADAAEFEAWAATLPGMEGNPTYAGPLDLRTRRDSPAKNRRIKRLRSSPAEGLALLTRDAASYCKSSADFAQGFMRPQGDVLFTCSAGESGCVDAYGGYQMCMMLRHPDTVYDLRSGTLREGLSEFFPRLRELRSTNPAYLRRCARCFLKGLCEQCPAKSWAEHGTLDTPVEYYCEMAHAQAVYLGLLAAGERAWEVTDWQARVQRLADSTLQRS